jgi:hypothetical protein
VKDPETSEEWQEAVDAAAGARTIADLKMYYGMRMKPWRRSGGLSNPVLRMKPKAIQTFPDRSQVETVPAFEVVAAEDVVGIR